MSPLEWSQTQTRMPPVLENNELSLGLLDTQTHKTFLKIFFKLRVKVSEYVKNWACQIDDFLGTGMMPRPPQSQNCTQIDCKSTRTGFMN